MADTEEEPENLLKRAVLRALGAAGVCDGNSGNADGGSHGEQTASNAAHAKQPDSNAAPGERPNSNGMELTPLAGGIGRRSYLASIGGAAWVVRTPRSGPPGSLDIQTERDITAQAAALGVTLPVVSCAAEDGLLITEYRRGAAAWTPEIARRPESIARIAAVLRRLHEIRLPGLRAFDPVAFAAEYLEPLGGERALPAAQRPFADALTMLARDYRARYPHMVLCHNDLVASNILDDGGLWLIDFEYAVTAAPVLDIAGIAAMNDYGRYERLQLSDAYYEGSPVPFSAAELDKVVRLVRLIAYFWALSSAEQTAEPEPYRRFAEHIEAQLT